MEQPAKCGVPGKAEESLQHDDIHRAGMLFA